MTDPTVDDRDRRTRILLLLLTAGALVPIWAAPIPPLQDLPNHLLKVDILERWLRGEDGVRQLYALNLRPLANYTCYAILLLLSPFASLITGARILLSIIVTALPWSAYVFLKRVHRESTLFALAVPALNFNLFFMMDLIPLSIIFLFHEGPFAWNGIFGFYLPFATFWVWFIVMTHTIRKSVHRIAETGAPEASWKGRVDLSSAG